MHPASPGMSLVCWIQPLPPGFMVVAVCVKEWAELKVLQGCASVQWVVGKLWVVPALVGQGIIQPYRCSPLL